MNYILIGIIVLGFILLFTRKKSISFSKYITDFTSYIAVLEYHMIKAYDIIYKDRIMIYSIEATKLNDREFSVVARDFLTLVLKMLGPNLVNEFIILYGNEETLFFNITEYFNTKFEDDEIRKNAVLSMSETESLT